MPSPRVLFAASALPGRGAPHPFMPAYWLKSRGFDVQVFCPGDGSAFLDENPLAPVPCATIPGGQLAFQFGLVKKLLAHRAKSDSNTVYYLHGHCCAPAALLGALPRRRLIYHTSDFLEPGRHPVWEFFERHAARRACCVLANEPNRARFLRSHYRLGAPPRVVPTYLPRAWPAPVFDPSIRRSLLHASAQHLLVHQGPFDPLRCGEPLLRALALLPRTFSLAFTGMRPESPPSRACLRLADSLQITGRVRLLDHLPFAQLQQITAVGDLGLLLYPDDGIGNFYQAPGRLTHYLSAGLPILASNFPGLELLTLKYGLGGTCAPDSPGAIAEAVRRLLPEPPAPRPHDPQRLQLLARTQLAYDTAAPQIEQAVQAAAAVERGRNENAFPLPKTLRSTRVR